VLLYHVISSNFMQVLKKINVKIYIIELWF